MTGSGGAAVALRGATLRYGRRVIWEHLDLDIAPGECLAILGPNGTGEDHAAEGAARPGSAVRRHGHHRRAGTRRTCR